MTFLTRTLVVGSVRKKSVKAKTYEERLANLAMTLNKYVWVGIVIPLGYHIKGFVSVSPHQVIEDCPAYVHLQFYYN